MMRSFLLIPCLLVCLACATPFPLDDLEKGMTAEAVRAEFGEPESINGSAWHYTDEEQDRVGTAFCFTIGLPGCILLTPFSLWCPGETGFSLMGVVERPVALYFESNKLDHWVLGAWQEKYGPNSECGFRRPSTTLPPPLHTHPNARNPADRMLHTDSPGDVFTDHGE